MHACWILLCMSLNILSYASLLNKEGTSKSTKSKGGIEGSIPRPMGGWGCYMVVSLPFLAIFLIGCYSEGVFCALLAFGACKIHTG
jgi:hypothetical protein